MRMDPGIVQNWSGARRHGPHMTLIIIAICFLITLSTVFVGGFQQGLPDQLGFVPAQIHDALRLPLSSWPPEVLLRLTTAAFAHVSWLHLAGNMAFLLIFAVPIERRIGHGLLLLLYLLGATITHWVLSLILAESTVPVIGASGAVSVVIGVYLGLFPTSRIGLFLPLGIYLQFARVPAVLVISVWFTLQLLYSVFGPINGAVAWWTHVVGFMLGLTLAIVLQLFIGRQQRNRNN